MKFRLNVKPLSSNQAWQGRRFSTKAKKQWERLVMLMLPNERAKGRWYKVTYSFFIRHFSITDADNLVKTLQDCLVKKGIIIDDRQIVEYSIRKFPSTVNRIEVEIEQTMNIPDWENNPNGRIGI